VEVSIGLPEINDSISKRASKASETIYVPLGLDFGFLKCLFEVYPIDNINQKII